MLWFIYIFKTNQCFKYTKSAICNTCSNRRAKWGSFKINADLYFVHIMLRFLTKIITLKLYPTFLRSLDIFPIKSCCSDIVWEILFSKVAIFHKLTGTRASKRGVHSTSVLDKCSSQSMVECIWNLSRGKNAFALNHRFYVFVNT